MHFSIAACLSVETKRWWTQGIAGRSHKLQKPERQRRKKRPVQRTAHLPTLLRAQAYFVRVSESASGSRGEREKRTRGKRRRLRISSLLQPLSQETFSPPSRNQFHIGKPDTRRQSQQFSQRRTLRDNQPFDPTQEIRKHLSRRFCLTLQLFFVFSKVSARQREGGSLPCNVNAGVTVSCDMQFFEEVRRKKESQSTDMERKSLIEHDKLNEDFMEQSEIEMVQHHRLPIPVKYTTSATLQVGKLQFFM